MNVSNKLMAYSNITRTHIIYIPFIYVCHLYNILFYIDLFHKWQILYPGKSIWLCYNYTILNIIILYISFHLDTKIIILSYRNQLIKVYLIISN